MPQRSLNTQVSFNCNDDIMHMDSIDEMDIMLMPSTDKEGDRPTDRDG